jgi:ABC-type transport system involved in Fe-S cluster assembly fused permease/ATPase subunit
MTFDKGKLGSKESVVDSHVNQNMNRLGLRGHEADRAKELTKTLWRGQKGIGQAAQEAADVIKGGK